ncbi:unnamed protein product [Choristocarpus tenellus]
MLRGVGGDEKANVYFFIATDEADSQKLSQKIWGDGCSFVKFRQPGSQFEGIKDALVDLLVMGSLDDYVMTPHSSFSELGAVLSFTWMQDTNVSLATSPNRPAIPIFHGMDNFELRKVASLLDRRAVPVGRGKDGGGGAREWLEGQGGGCMRQLVAGLSLVVARGRELQSLFEAIEKAPCLAGKSGIANL